MQTYTLKVSEWIFFKVMDWLVVKLLMIKFRFIKRRGLWRVDQSDETLCFGRGLCRGGAPTIESRPRWIHMDYMHERCNLIQTRKAVILHAGGGLFR